MWLFGSLTIPFELYFFIFYLFFPLCDLMLLQTGNEGQIYLKFWLLENPNLPTNNFQRLSIMSKMFVWVFRRIKCCLCFCQYTEQLIQHPSSYSPPMSPLTGKIQLLFSVATNPYRYFPILKSKKTLNKKKSLSLHKY